MEYFQGKKIAKLKQLRVFSKTRIEQINAQSPIFIFSRFFKQLFVCFKTSFLHLSFYFVLINTFSVVNEIVRVPWIPVLQITNAVNSFNV